MSYVIILVMIWSSDILSQVKFLRRSCWVFCPVGLLRASLLWHFSCDFLTRSRTSGVHPDRPNFKSSYSIKQHKSFGLLIKQLVLFLHIFSDGKKEVDSILTNPTSKVAVGGATTRPLFIRENASGDGRRRTTQSVGLSRVAKCHNV